MKSYKSLGAIYIYIVGFNKISLCKQKRKEYKHLPSYLCGKGMMAKNLST